MPCYLENPHLFNLRDVFAARGHTLWFVGGCVRDFLAQVEPHDIDLCTDATIEEQAELYRAEGLIAIPKGIAHGTYTVRLEDGEYEITSLLDTTGQPTKRIESDLAHRDFTINAMAQTFEGKLIDPFGGADDLQHGIVRFVGNAEDRLLEDPLRLMRYFRFSAMYRTIFNYPRVPELKQIAQYLRHVDRLIALSPQRLWNEYAKALKHSDKVLHFYQDFGITQALGIRPDEHNFVDHARQMTNDPVSLMTAYVQNPNEIWKIGTRFGWNSGQKAKAMVLAERFNGPMEIENLKLRVAAHGDPLEWVAEAATICGWPHLADALRTWKQPTFPLTLEEVGNEEIYRELKLVWGYSGFRMGRKALMTRVERTET